MQDQGKRLLLVVALMLGVFLVWRLLARPDEPGKQAQTRSQPSGSAVGSAAAPAQPAPAKGATVSLPPGATYAQRFAALCAACHGASGRIETPLTPVLAGQPSLTAGRHQDKPPRLGQFHAALKRR